MQHRNLTHAANAECGSADRNVDLSLNSASQPALAREASAFALSASRDEVEIAGRRYVRQRRLAKLLNVSARTLARWNACGIGPPKITIGKTVLFDLEKLPEWLATRETAPTRNPRR
jgi:hypothetical protein